MRFLHGQLRACIAASFIVLALMLCLATGAKADRSIYFTDVSGQLNLTSSQRPQVEQAFNKSERDTLKVFAKHGINPDAKPDFDKLFGARHELQAIAQRERNLMKRVLTKAQFKIYRKLMDHIQARIIKATRND